MKGKNNVRPPALIAGACALVLAIGVLTFAGPCVHEDGSASACATAGTAVLAGAAVALVAALAGAFVGRRGVRFVLMVVAALAGAFAMAAPGGIFPLCMMQTMRCWAVMRPVALGLGAAVCVLSLVEVVLALRKRGE